MRLVEADADPPGCHIIHFSHFRHWRMTGLAFEVRDCQYNTPNSTLISAAVGRTKDFKNTCAAAPLLLFHSFEAPCTLHIPESRVDAPLTGNGCMISGLVATLWSQGMHPFTPELSSLNMWCWAAPQLWIRYFNLRAVNCSEVCLQLWIKIWRTGRGFHGLLSFRWKAAKKNA